MALAATDLAALAFVLSVGLCVGTAITLEEIWDAMQRVKPIAVGLGAQFLFMPLMAFALTHILQLEDAAEVSGSGLILGASLVGCMPGGTTSNLFTWMVKGNVPLSIIMSFVSTIAAVGLTPLCLFIFYQSRYSSAGDTEIPYLSIFGTLVIVIFGVGGGLLVRKYRPDNAVCLSKVCAGIAVVFLVGALFLGYLKDRDLLSCPFKVWVYCFLIQPIGYLGGLGFAHLSGTDWADVMTISIETGIQNFAMALAIVALSVNKDAPTYSDTARVPSICALLYPFHCLWIVVAFRQFPPPEPEAAKDGDLDPEGVVHTETEMTEASGAAEPATVAAAAATTAHATAAAGLGAAPAPDPEAAVGSEGRVASATCAC